MLGTVQQLSTILESVSRRIVFKQHTIKQNTDSSFAGGCLALTNPMNGAFEPVFSRLPGSTVNIQCDAGYVSAVAMVTCDDTLMWSPNPEATECTSLPTLPPTTRELSFCVVVQNLLLFFYLTAPMNCRASLPPPRNGTIGNHSVPAIPGTQVTFQCDDGLFPERTMTATCLATGEWDKNPGEIVCRNESSKLPGLWFNSVSINLFTLSSKF